MPQDSSITRSARSTRIGRGYASFVDSWIDEATICMVTHDPRYATVADRSVHLFDGQVVDEEDALRDEHAHKFEASGLDV